VDILPNLPNSNGYLFPEAVFGHAIFSGSRPRHEGGNIALIRMPARRKLDLEKIHASLNAICSHCGASIPPEDQNRVDFEHMKCPQCGETFIPAKRER